MIQEEVYEIGKRCGFADDLRAWFKSLYEILLGQTEGPRFGSFVAYYGPAETAALIRQALDGRPLDPPARLSFPAWHRPRRAAWRWTCSTGCWASSSRSTTRLPAIRRSGL